MKPLLIAIFLVLLLSANALPQTIDAPPTRQMLIDYSLTQIAWNYAPQKRQPATGFRIYCGDKANCDIDNCWYYHATDVPDPKARAYLIGPLVDEVVQAFGKPAPGTSGVMAHVQCMVIPYNATGEAIPQVAGVPALASNIRFLPNLK